MTKRRKKTPIPWLLCIGLIAGSLIIPSKPPAVANGSEKSMAPADDIDLAAGILTVGELQHTVYNNGQLGTFAIQGYLVPELPCGWYRGYGYIASLDIWVGLPEGHWNPPGILGPTVSEPTINYDAERSDWGPRFGSLGWFHSGDVTVGDLIPDTRLPDLPMLATSTLPGTWPEGFFNESGSFVPTPGLRHWPGPWKLDPETGQEIEGQFTADTEVFFSITDEGYADRDDQLDQGFPIDVQTDFSVLAFKASYAEDILFFMADVINTSSRDYWGMYIGLYFDADVEDLDSLGSSINDNEDWMKCLRKEYDEIIGDTIRYDLAYIYDFRPQPNWRAYTGIATLETPKDTSGQELGLTDWHWFDWSDRPGTRDTRKERIQYKILSGDTTDLLPEEQIAFFHPNREGQLDPHFDDWEMIPEQYPNGLDCAFLLSTGPFTISADDTAHFTFALIMGDDENDLKLNAKTAHAMYDFRFETQIVTLFSPTGGERVSGVIQIEWAASSVTDRPLNTIDIRYSSNNGTNWSLIAGGEENDGSYDWDTDSVPDGTRYRMMISTTDDLLPGEDCSDTTFTIDNPKQAVPEVRALSPNGGESISGSFDIEWWAKDADGDPLSIDIYYSPSNGLYWELITQEEENDGRYRWDTWKNANGNRGLIRIIASDGDTASEDLSNRNFSLLHQRSEIEAEHVAGHGNGEVHILTIDSTDFTGHTYQLAFEDSSDRKLYHVFDETTEQYVLQDQQDMSGRVESPYFDGLRVSITDWPSIEVIDSLTHWNCGDNSWIFHVQAIHPYPADYEIRYTVDGDTSILTAIPVPFQIYNLTEEHPIDFIVQDDDGSNDWSSGDVIIFTEPFPVYTWRVTLSVSPLAADTIDPRVGDALTIIISKPFTSDDIFRFNTSSTAVSGNMQEHVHPQDFILFQNYPNPFNPKTDIRYQIAEDRSPVHTTLKVYNILGQEVRTLVDEIKEPGYHTVTWDGRNTPGKEIASGIYFYRLSVNNDQWSATRCMILMK